MKDIVIMIVLASVGVVSGWVLRGPCEGCDACEPAVPAGLVPEGLVSEIPLDLAPSSGTVPSVSVPTPEDWSPGDWKDFFGEWRDAAGGQLPWAKIGRPNPKREFNHKPPDYNVKFRIPTLGGIYEGGCDVYLSDEAYCRIHDPSDPKTKLEGVKMVGLANLQVKGDTIRVTVPNGVSADLVSAPISEDR